MAQLTVYVPAPGSDLRDRIWSGSGIVGSPVGDSGRLRVDFEGDMEIYPSYTARVRRAAERHTWSYRHASGYPSRACAYVDPDQVVRVGTYFSERKEVVVDDPDPLADWLELEELEPGQFSG